MYYKKKNQMSLEIAKKQKIQENLSQLKKHAERNKSNSRSFIKRKSKSKQRSKSLTSNIQTKGKSKNGRKCSTILSVRKINDERITMDPSDNRKQKTQMDVL